MTNSLRLLGWGSLILVGVLLHYILAEPTVITEPYVIIAAQRIRDSQPPANPTWRDRIVYKYAPPLQTAVAPGGGLEELTSFCRPVVLAITDTVRVEVAPEVVVTSGVSRDGWWLQRGTVDLVGFTNAGDLKRFTHPTRPDWDFRTSGDTVLVRYPRMALPRQIAEVAIPPALVLVACHFLGC